MSTIDVDNGGGGIPFSGGGFGAPNAQATPLGLDLSDGKGGVPPSFTPYVLEWPLTSDNKTKQLPDVKCDFAMLANWTVTDAVHLTTTVSGAGTSAPDSQAAQGREIYYGFGKKLFAQLFTGTTTGFLPVTNLNQICARTPNGVAAILRVAYWVRNK